MKGLKKLFTVILRIPSVLGINLALGKPTNQSGTLLKGESSNAVDGFKHPNISENSCIHTDNRYEPWWYVDLQALYYVTSVVISNRGDCCDERLTNFEIKVGREDTDSGIRNPRCAPKFNQQVGPGKSVEISCDEPMLGRFVTIIINGTTGILNFCEVEVYGKRREWI